MLHSYFEFRKEQNEVLDSIKYDLDFVKYSINSSDLYSSLKKKISNLNEYQFFNTLCDLMYDHPVKYLKDEIIECFFEPSLRIDNKNDLFQLPFQDDYKEYKYIPTYDLHISLNYKSDVEQLVAYYLNTEDYSKNVLINKLLVLIEEILNQLYLRILTIKHYFQYFTENSDLNDGNTKIVNAIYIIKALEDQEFYIIGLTNNIQKKIDSLSKTTILIENYFIKTSDEILKKLYNGLEKFMFIDQNKTTLEQFIKVLKFDWKEHNDVINLAMDNIQFKFFIDCLYKFLNIKIDLTIIQIAENIINKNGVIKASSVYVSVSKSKMLAKDADIIKSIFDKL